MPKAIINCRATIIKKLENIGEDSKSSGASIELDLIHSLNLSVGFRNPKGKSLPILSKIRSREFSLV